jgi:hypothetical protein
MYNIKIKGTHFQAHEMTIPGVKKAGTFWP